MVNNFIDHSPTLAAKARAAERYPLFFILYIYIYNRRLRPSELYSYLNKS